MMAKIQPSVLTLEFALDSAATGIVDISQCASICSRRFYRQGLGWAVGGFTLRSTIPAQNSGTVTIKKIPSTWIASNAWHKAYAHWKSQQDDAVDEAGAQSSVAKFRDFKIHANVEHVAATFAQNLIPKDSAGNPFLTGEWAASEIVVPNLVADASGSEVDPYEYLLHMVGANANAAATSRGIIDGYQSSRAYPQSPDPVGPAVGSTQNWMQQMDDVGNDNPEILTNAQYQNDDLPYNQIEYPGSEHNAPVLELVHETTMIPAVGTTTRQLSGTIVPCGLLEIYNDSPSELDLVIHLIPGPSRGYMTQPMQDM